MDKKILLVADDDDMNRLIIKKFLKSNYDIIEATNGKEAMELLHSTHVDALLLDIIMPEMDGLMILEAMSEDASLSHVGVLVATSTKEKTERQALSLGADDIVSKPYDPVVIKKRMENILAKKAMKTQQELLKSNDMDLYIKNQHDKLYSQVESEIKKIISFADIIRANKSNYKLVDEILDEIKVETELILESMKQED